MSDLIQLLPDNIANQIAAGEVIQRPASVVKELIENAVDAQSTKIELHIKDAGRTSIQVIDNGKGMSKMDARMCFERHATSKLKSADDLFNLTTKGFRGEAMASIAAIAHVDLETKIEANSVGTKVSIQGSKVTNQEPVVRPTGTSITVKNLFFNVPARRNFLKSDSAETKHIVEEFNRVALTHPEIAFKLTHNGNVVFDLQEANRRKRIVDLHGNAFNNKLVPVEEKTDIVSIAGFVGKPEFARKTRGEQYFFVNNRFFKDSYLHHAVSAAFENLIPPKTFPSYFLYLEVDPKTIDVNIHPTKTEIKFEDERSIYSILRSAVKLALGVHNIAPSLDFEHEPQFELPLSMKNAPLVEPQIKVDPSYNPFNVGKSSSSSSQTPSGDKNKWTNLQPNRSDWENFYEINTEKDKEVEQPLIPEEEVETNHSSHARSIQIHGKFLITQIKSGLLCINISRAKERILYDELMEQFIQCPITSQQLLFPVEIKCKDEEKKVWEENKVSIHRLGFSWSWNLKTMVLDGIPSFLTIDDVESCVLEMIHHLMYKEIDKGSIAHEMILTLAKTDSKHINYNLSQEEISHLINTLFLSNEHQYTPRGKKIMNSISVEEMNNWF